MKELIITAKILIVIGSARKGRVADKITQYVQSDLADRTDTIVTVADLKEIDLPFFENENSPLSPDYVINDVRVQAWSDMVSTADHIVFITPEYNHSLTAIQKNAVDSLGTEWIKKSVTAVAYGWTGGSQAVEEFRKVMTKMDSMITPTVAQLTFMKDLQPDGTLMNEGTAVAQIKNSIDELQSVA
ncbi:NAD(P)H-dependent oxidoreductase [Candidatus Saccharibacteria bacterium]|nr:NAD(P)H-dependent oxidoreductase [Candidatus Saccharibacteria bacterium]